MNIIIIKLFFISNFISILSLITENQNINSNSTLKEVEDEEEYFINDMSEEEFIKTNTEQFNNFFNLEEGKSSYCDLCKSGSDILLNTIIQEYKWSYLHSFCTFGCSLKLRKDICNAAVGRYGPVVIENTFKRLLNREKICTSLFICKSSVEYESIEEYGRRILKNKNNSKGKEFTFIQLTDTHLQLDYQEGKVINCNIPLCCRNTPEELGYKNKYRTI